MEKIINFELMRHPANWLVLTLMFLLGSFAIRFILNASQIGDASAVN